MVQKKNIREDEWKKFVNMFITERKNENFVEK